MYEYFRMNNLLNSWLLEKNCGTLTQPIFQLYNRWMNKKNHFFVNNCILTGCLNFQKMASQKVSECHQDLVTCGLCQNPVSFFCRRCLDKLCDSCVPIHLRVKSEFGHDVVEYASHDDDDNVSVFCYKHMMLIILNV